MTIAIVRLKFIIPLLTHRLDKTAQTLDIWLRQELKESQSLSIHPFSEKLSQSVNLHKSEY